MSGPDRADGAAVLAAQARLEALFRTFDRLTPDELGRIGYRPAPDEERDELMAAVDDAARRSGRTALVNEARGAARDAVLRRYAESSLHPTWLALNWGISSGTVADRVAIVETLADAAAAAVVEDLLDPEAAASLAFDAADVVGVAAGVASEGSIARALAEPADADLGRSDGRHLLRITLAVLAMFVAALAGLGALGLVAAPLLGLWGSSTEGGWIVALGTIAAVTLVALVVANRRPQRSGEDAES